MKKQRVELSDMQKNTLGWLITAGMFLVLGLTFLFMTGFKNLTENDFKEVEIVYGRIQKTTGEDPMYIIFSKSDEKSFLIGNIVAPLFSKSSFDTQVSSGNTITLTVLKSDYESKTTRITTLGVKKGNAVFLDFTKAFDTNKNNDKLGHYTSIAFLAIAGVLAIAVVIWRFVFKGKESKTLTGKNLSIKTEDSKITIHFPVGIGTIIIYIFIFLSIVGLPLFFIGKIQNIDIAIVAGILVYGILVIFNVVSFVMHFLRKLTIDKEQRTCTYFSYFKKTFGIDEILTLDTDTVDNSESFTNYYLIIGTISQTIKIKTQSNEQSLKLREEILALRSPFGMSSDEM